MILVLAMGFVVQTALVYTDPGETVQLNAQAVAGRHLWQRSNCQVCHQLYGFGGFLGPDLTNAAARMERTQLDSLLTQGRGQMPAFKMQPDEIDAIWSFLNAMNKTGIGQARNPKLVQQGNFVAVGDAELGEASTPTEALNQIIAESGNDSVAEGFRLVETGTCLACHVLYARSAIGAPDLSLSGSQLTPDEIATVLANGRLPLMPTPALSPDEQASVRAFIIFMAEHRQSTLSRVVTKPGSFWISLPWWEYK